MNHNLNFRIWDGKKFLSGRELDDICLDPEGDVLIREGRELCLAGDEYLASQFTGLLDKNGKEIYEGDLVNFYTPGRSHGPEREDFTYEEVWYDENSASFVFGKIYYDGWHGYGTWDVKDLEVVGNVFENSGKVKKYVY